MAGTTKTAATMDRKVLAKAVKVADNMTSETSFALRLAIDGNAVRVQTETPGLGKADVKVAAGVMGDAVVVGLTPAFLADFLRLAKSDEVRVEISKPDRAVRLVEVGGDLVHLVMPVTKD